MTFPLEHWDDPRATIASGFHHNDLGYATSGARAAANVIRALDRRPAELAELSLLDFGCGTGRVTRPLSFHFGRVVGYDPNPACIAAALDETERCRVPKQTERPRYNGFVNLSFVGPDDIDALSGFDVVCCIATIYHLPAERQLEMARKMAATLCPGGVAVIHYRTKLCQRLVAELWGEDPCPSAAGRTQIGLVTKGPG